MANAVALKAGSGRKKPGALLRWVSKWPELVFRLHLGWLLGDRFMLVVHRGRKTGRIRRTGVMVLEYDGRTGEAFVVAGSRDADWYRNIQTSPAVEIMHGRRQYRPVQRFLSSNETAELLGSSRRQAPFQALVQALFFGWPLKANRAELLILADKLGGVAFRPNDAYSEIALQKGGSNHV